MQPEAWRHHPLTQQGVVELIPLTWLWSYRGLDVVPARNHTDPHYVDVVELANDIKHHGLMTPLIIRVGLTNKKFRLEAGNHRIQVLKELGVSLVPATVEIKAYCGPEAPDNMTVATHNFDVGDDLLIEKPDAPYMKPSAVFKSLATLRATTTL